MTPTRGNPGTVETAQGAAPAIPREAEQDARPAPAAGDETSRLLLPSRRVDPECRWRVLHVRSRQEKALEQTLRAMDVSCYLPLRRVERRYGTRRAESMLPLFPGYLFLWGRREEVFAADRTRRVAQVIEVPDQAHLEWELANVHRALGTGAMLDPHPAFQEGVRVRVVSGPFEGLEGIVRSRRTADRLVLQVRMLNTATSLDIQGELVEAVEG
jgi:transcription termination/antitermination protein NusG